MKCKFCEAELEEGVMLCPACGGDNAPEEIVEFPDVNEDTQTEEAAIVEEAAEPVEVETAPSNEAAPQKPKRKIWQTVLGIVAAVLFLAALAIILLTAFGVDIRPRPNDINKKDTYSAADEAAIKAADKVVAVVNGRELTNGALQIYYKMQVVDFLNVNAQYLSYMNFDYTKPLSEQICYYDETLDWEQYFINVAIQTWQNYQSVYMLSVEQGFVPSEELRTSLEELPAGIEEMAAGEGFESADALIKDRFGVTCKLEDYLNYCRVMYVASEFVGITPTMEQLENYYTENEAFFIDNNVDKNSGPMVNVRHILLEPHEHEDAAVEETEPTDAAETTPATETEETTEATEATQGEETTAPTEAAEEEQISEEAWADCLKHAEELLAQWKSGDATEESFAALANEYSVDGGSNTTGGLYTGITKETSFVEPFLAWCMDESRQVGDTGIVKTDFGYHIMYFAYTQPQWLYYAEQYFLSDYAEGLINQGKEQWPIEINYKNILLPTLALQ